MQSATYQTITHNKSAVSSSCFFYGSNPLVTSGQLLSISNTLQQSVCTLQVISTDNCSNQVRTPRQCISNNVVLAWDVYHFEIKLAVKFHSLQLPARQLRLTLQPPQTGVVRMYNEVRTQQVMTPMFQGLRIATNSLFVAS